MDKLPFNKGDLVRWKHGASQYSLTETLARRCGHVGVVVELGHDMGRLQNRWTNKELYVLVHWDKGIETKVYEKHSSWNGVEVIVRAEEEI